MSFKATGNGFGNQNFRASLSIVTNKERNELQTATFMFLKEFSSPVYLKNVFYVVFHTVHCDGIF